MTEDPLGDNDPLVMQALEELLKSTPPSAWTSRHVYAIDSLIQARITVALESLTDAALGKLSQRVK